MLLHQSSGQWRLGLSLSLITAVLWGTLPVAEAILLQALDIGTVNWFRFLSSFLLLGLYLMLQQPLSLQRVKTAIAGFRLRPIEWGLLAVATVGLAGDYVLYLQGLIRTSPGNAEVLIQLAPVLMSLGAIALFKERYSRSQWLGVGVLSLGFVLFFHEKLRALLTPSAQYLLGSGLIVLAAITWAAYALAQKQLLQRLSASTILLIIYGVCSIAFSPGAVPQRILSLSPLYVGILIFCGLNTLFAYAAFSEALNHWEASKISAVAALTPIVTLGSMMLLAAIAPGLLPPEHITPLGVWGAVFVIGGSMLIALGQGTRPPEN